MTGVAEICKKRLEFSQVHLASISSFKVCSIHLPVESGAMIREVPNSSLCVVLFTFLDCHCCCSIEISELMC